jgi:4-hydroxybenzoate polyprenyltransferase
MLDTGAPHLPLVVDLDGTLLRTDSLHETLLDAARTAPLALGRLSYKVFAGPAAVKQYLAGVSEVDVDTWPVEAELVQFLKDEADGGRRIVLATAADQRIADAIAKRFAFIDEVIASDGERNLKGPAKAARLRERFPEGFIYAGNSVADLQVWRSSSEIILVNAPDGVARQARRLRPPLREFARRSVSLNVLRRGLRLHQWAKNALIFVPLVLGGKVADPDAWANAALGFLALGLCASATYLINDLWDLPNDRRHWSKQYRPLASGDLSIPSSLFLAAFGFLGGVAIALFVGLAPAAVVAAYVGLSLSYSFSLKRIPILDVLILATLFTLRLGFGVVLTSVPPSPWLFVFSMFVFLSLSTAKRHTEVLRMTENGIRSTHGRGYVAADAPLTLGIGLASMLGSVLILVLYLIDEAFAHGSYANPAVLWSTPVTLFLFLGRVWTLSQRGQLKDDPVAFALKDRTSWALGLLMVLAFVGAVVNVGG